MTKKRISAYEQALKYLGLKMYSSGDLLFRLTNKGYENSEIEKALVQLEREGFVSDKSYARIYLENLMNYRSFGFYGARVKLLQKRLDKGLVDRVLKDFFSEEAEEEIANRFIKKPSNGRRSRQSLVSALKRKGFRTSVIFKILA